MRKADKKIPIQSMSYWNAWEEYCQTTHIDIYSEEAINWYPIFQAGIIHGVKTGEASVLKVQLHSSPLGIAVFSLLLALVVLIIVI